MLTIKLSRHLFWDFNIPDLDDQKNKNIIIERVFTLGDIPEIKEVILLYGIDTIKAEIVKLAYLDKKTLQWASIFFDIPKTEFLCYAKIQSNQVHWNF